MRTPTSSPVKCWVSRTSLRFRVSLSLNWSVLGLKDVITFQGESVSELEQAFHDSVDDYLEWCSEDGVDPEKPYSGKMLLRFDPNLHRRVAAAAKKKKMSVNKFMEKAAEDELMQG